MLIEENPKNPGSQEYQLSTEEEDIRLMLAETRNYVSGFLKGSFKNKVPQQIQKKLLNMATPELIESSKKAQSSIVEDFIASYVAHNQGKDISEEDIVVEFLSQNIPGQISLFDEEVKEIADSIDIDELISDKDISKIKDEIVGIMKSLGVSESELIDLKETNVKFVNININSHARLERTIVISIPQMVRKAVDYQLVFGSEKSINDIIKALLFCIISHEFGHKADILPSHKNSKSKHLISKKIPATWENADYSFEMVSKSERFAEFVAQKAIGNINGEYLGIRKEEKLLGFLEINRLWSEIEKYNKTHEEKIDLAVLFEMIAAAMQNAPNKEKSAALLLVNARKSSYTTSAPEAYLLPFSEEEVEESIRKIHSAR